MGYTIQMLRVSTGEMRDVDVSRQWSDTEFEQLASGKLAPQAARAALWFGESGSAEEWPDDVIWSGPGYEFAVPAVTVDGIDIEVDGYPDD